MKKLLAGIMTFMMIFMFATPGGTFAKARADQKIKLADAIDTVKNVLNINTENYNFNYNYNENRDGISTWELNWSSKKSVGGGIYVSVNSETGDIINFNNWEPITGQTTKIPKYSKDKAYEEVVNFVKKVAPSKFPQTVLNDKQNAVYYDMPMSSDTYSFNFIRKVNGLDFPENGINISIDKNTLKVRSYNLNWDNGTFADPSKAISLEDAKKAFANKSGIELSYNIITDYSKKTQTPMLVYTLKNGGSTIDALTGELLQNNYRIYATEKAMDMANTKGSARTPEEQKSIDESSKYVSKDVAITEAKKYVDVDDKAKLNSAGLYVNEFDNTATWNFYWDRTDSAKQYYGGASASVDAVTGKIKSFYLSGNEYYPEKETPVKYTTEQAVAMAEKFISGIEPDKFKLVKKDNAPTQGLVDKVTDYYFNYVAYINGAKCSFDTFNIAVNAYSGRIMNYSKNWNDIALPAADKALTLENAYKALYNKAKFNLKYTKVYNYDGIKAGTSEIKLAYVLDDFSGTLDANNGTFLDYNGKPVVEKKTVKYSDIKGNKAENDINLLVDLGVIDDKGDNYRPNETISQKDLIKMLVKSLGQGYYAFNGNTEEQSSYDVYYDTAIQRNIITEAQKKPDAVITKQEAAKLIIRAMGIGYLGEAGGIYNVTFKDASKLSANYKGYAALATGLKILTTSNGNFNGTQSFTRGDAATAVVNYLKVDVNK